MFVYKFYLIPENEKSLEDYKKSLKTDISLRDIYPLYAVTNKKKYAKRFLKERKKDRFYMIKDEINKEEYALFVNKNRSTELQSYPYKTYYTKDDRYVKTKVYLVTTYSEYNYVADTVESGLFEENVVDFEKWINPIIFREDYLDALKTVKFVDNYVFINGYMHPDDDDLLDSYTPPEMNFDELSILLQSFGYLFK